MQSTRSSMVAAVTSNRGKTYGLAQLLPLELNYEIVRILRHELYAVDGRIEMHPSLKTARRDLYALAQTCRSFCTPALDSLWEEMDSLVPLLSLLIPALQLDRLPDGSPPRVISYTIAKPITAESWLCFDQYRARILSLNSSEYVISPAIFEVLARSRPDTLPILPNIQKLVWENYSSAGSLGIFIAPSLKVLYIGRTMSLGYLERNRDLRALENVLQTLAVQAPSLLSMELNNQEMFGRSLQGLFQCQNLTNLVLRDPVSDGVMRSLSHMSQLKSISLRVRDLDLGDRSAWPTFPNLESITFNRSPLNCVVAVLQQLSTTRLAHLTLESDFGDRIGAPPRVFEELFSALVQSKQTLKTVRISDIFSFVDNLEFMRPLFQCHEIEEFDFRKLIASTEMDEAMEDLARAWPKIEKLQLCCRINPRSLVVFARECRNLRRLHVSHINMIDIPSMNSIAQVEPHGLQMLYTDYVGAVDLVGGTRFLERLFPSLAQKFYGNEPEAMELYPFLLQHAQS
ncbi:hypothetical protein NEOLEDRAFT_1239786 [Neolentinus lepideus HHB14362 ss-1]|uniref:F-box domain-containing protein n=1 Tax=Neolentinus lepideus HHB14362 ss-1 TaxID=1314782 RepID=A0A165UE67_9AGAM|nr:hypothetical protein NEOLEDRAFT_1239786 [Neolentinus lepideus HHB14362 ss-1]